MKSIPVLLSIFVLVCGPIWGSDATDGRRFVIEAYKRSDAASVRKDSQTLLSLLAPDYKGEFNDRTVTKAGMSRNMKLMFSIAKTIRIKTTIKTLSYQEGKITVLAQEYASLQGTHPRTHKPLSLVTDSTFQDVWRKTGSHWLKQHTLTLRVKSKLNGKPVDPWGNNKPTVLTAT
ncbi:hypothetical protein IAD21_01791 [Abditibacteriota bacterium]|nr:hypothetical protein IAD21_01791 [Abditibacteriota bacterium]